MTAAWPLHVAAAISSTRVSSLLGDVVRVQRGGDGRDADGGDDGCFQCFEGRSVEHGKVPKVGAFSDVEMRNIVTHATLTTPSTLSASAHREHGKRRLATWLSPLLRVCARLLSQ